MAECLGIYLENNLIKYAKVSKDHDRLNVESFGLKMYDEIEDAIDQIVRETSSTRTPISINLSDEIYNYFEIFAMLNKKDIERTIKTEFEYLCEERGVKQNTIESRHFLIPSKENNEKIRAVHISTNRVEIAKKTQQFQGKMLREILPLPVALTTLIDVDQKENFAIVNIEEKTTITLIIEGQVYKVQVLDEGMKEIFDKISAKENSLARAYEICKNTTIYTTDSQPTDVDEFLEDIMPTLYKVVEKTKTMLKESVLNISKVYITGSGAVINNIDLYFQDNLSKVKCQILKPYFLNAEQGRVGINDYIEVNSAIALALQGLGEGIKGLNFKNLSFSEKIPVPTIDLSGGIGGKIGDALSGLLKTNIDLSFNKQLDGVDKGLLRLAGSLLLAVILYSGFSYAVGNAISEKENDAKIASDNIATQIRLAQSDIEQIRTRTSEYATRITKLNESSEKVTEKTRNKNSIPNLLNRIMYTVPKSVQITSIKNTQDKHIVITAQSDKYEQLGYLKGQLSVDGILKDVKSDSGVKQDGIVKVTIEGDLP